MKTLNSNQWQFILKLTLLVYLRTLSFLAKNCSKYQLQLAREILFREIGKECYGLIFMFYGISTFVKNPKINLVEEPLWYYLTHSSAGKRSHTFPKDISLKVYKEYIWLVWFYGILTIVGYLMPNPFYTYSLKI